MQEQGKRISDTALIIMARYPEMGKTKTRLASAIGDDETLQLYRAFLTDLARRFAGSAYDLYWAYTPAGVDYPAFIATLMPAVAASMQYFPQQGTDLGERLHHVFQYTSERGYTHTIAIGSDSPHIGLTRIEQAQKALDGADVVLGPAEDGGYYLIAMQKPHDVFRDIPMSTNVVTQMTIERAQRHGLTVYLIEPSFDIDELSDLRRLMSLLEADPTIAPTTATYLDLLRNHL
jgi:rSAM/selenodomain-associated transferase 1